MDVKSLDQAHEKNDYDRLNNTILSVFIESSSMGIAYYNGTTLNLSQTVRIHTTIYF